MILRPFNSRVAVLAPDDGDGGFVDVCTGPAGRVISAATRPAAYPYVRGTHTFFRLTLAAGPREVASEAKAAAAREIASAYAAFMSTRCTDTGYASLNDLYALANEEYYQGGNFHNRGLLSGGREETFDLARATTAYARAQQIYEALNPPPTSPSDLALRPFGGDWADWETEVGESG